MNEKMKNGCEPCGTDDCRTSVSCDVKNCIHHDGQKLCNAGMIHVGPHHANNSQDTICSTFKSK